MSAVMFLDPFTIDVTRLAGTRMSFESLFALSPSGLRYSSRRISPGWIGRMPFLITFVLLVVVDDFDVLDPGVGPTGGARCETGR